MYREKSWQALWEEENLCFPRRKPSGKERRREMIDSSSMSYFGQHWERSFFV